MKDTGIIARSDLVAHRDDPRSIRLGAESIPTQVEVPGPVDRQAVIKSCVLEVYTQTLVVEDWQASWLRKGALLVLSKLAQAGCIGADDVVFAAGLFDKMRSSK